MSGKRRHDVRLKEREKFRPNVLSFTITTGKKFWYVVSAYVPPNNKMTVHWVDQALARGQEGVEMLLVRDVNTAWKNLEIDTRRTWQQPPQTIGSWTSQYTSYQGRVTGGKESGHGG